MKKFCALLAAVVMTAMVLTSCGDSDSSSKKDSSKADDKAPVTTLADDESEPEETKPEEKDPEESVADSSEDESEPDEDSEPEGEGTFGPLTQAFADKIKAGKYAMKMKMDASAFLGATGMIDTEFKYNNGDSYVHTTLMGMETEIYTVAGTSITVLTASNTYQEGSNVNVSFADNLTRPDGATYVGSSEEDGLTVEKYTIAGGGEGKFCFDSDGNIKKIVTSGSDFGDMTVEIDSISFDDVTIELPDLSKMTKYDPTNTDPTEAIKMTLSVLGITEDMVTKAGYTYDQLAGMGDEMLEVVKKIAKDNGIDSALLDMFA